MSRQQPGAPASPPVCCRLLGSPVGVRVPHAEDRAAVAAILGGFPSHPCDESVDRTYSVDRAHDSGWLIGREGLAPDHAATLESALLALEFRLVTDLLDGLAGRFHLHGSALADPTGTMSVLIAGESGAGKTTLTLALMATGFLPYTDDVVVVDPATMTPATFERAFHVDGATRALIDPLPHPPDWQVAGMPEGYLLPTRWARQPAPVGAIIIPKRRDGVKPLLVGLSIADTTTTLLGFSGTLDRDPALALAVAARLTASARGFALLAGPPGPTAEFLAQTLAGLAGGTHTTS